MARVASAKTLAQKCKHHVRFAFISILIAANFGIFLHFDFSGNVYGEHGGGGFVFFACDQFFRISRKMPTKKKRKCRGI